MNLWDQNVINDIFNLYNNTYFLVFDTPHQLLAVQSFTLNWPDAVPMGVEFICDRSEQQLPEITLDFISQVSASTTPQPPIAYVNLLCDRLGVVNYAEQPVQNSIFYTTSASGTLMISDATHTAFIENKMNLGDIFIIGFLTIFLTIIIFKSIWNFVFPKITKGKSINDL